MTLKSYLMANLSHQALVVGMPRITAKEAAAVMAMAYRGLRLKHLKGAA